MSKHAHHVLYYHVVFTTKRRAPLLSEENLQAVKNAFAAKANDLGIEILAINGCIDHMHLLLQLSKASDLGKIVGQLKGYSSRMNTHVQWQIGYAAFTVSASAVSFVRKYIRDQKRHHQGMDYRGEMSALKKHTLNAMGLPVVSLSNQPHSKQSSPPSNESNYPSQSRASRCGTRG